MNIKTFDNLEEIQKYYDKKRNTYIFEEDGNYFGLVIFSFDLNVKANIRALNIIGRDIKALNITALDIRCGDITASNIVAGNIDANDIKARYIDAFDINAIDITARDIDVDNIKAKSICARNINCYVVCNAIENIKCKSIKREEKMTKEELKMTSKEALERLENVLTWSGDIDIDTDLYNLWIDLACRTIEKDLDRLEKLEKENQELKGKVNHFEKVIESIKNLPNLDCTHMFDNCKKLTPLPDVEELKMTGKEAYGKLDKILNIEEEIGIDLTILFNALKNGVYYFDEQGQLIYSYVWLTDNHIAAGVHDKLSYSFKTPYHETLLFEDYGKIWALSEEELRTEKLEKRGTNDISTRSIN